MKYSSPILSFDIDTDTLPERPESIVTASEEIVTTIDPQTAANGDEVTIGDDESAFLFGQFFTEKAASEEVDSQPVSHTRDTRDLPNDRHPRHHRHPESPETDPLAGVTDPGAEDLEQSITCIEEAIRHAEDNPGALASEAFNAAVRLVRERDLEAWFRLRGPLMRACRKAGVQLSEIEKSTRPASDDFEDNTCTADELVALVQDQAELFHAEDGACFATLKASPRKTYRLDSQAFAEWVGYAYYRVTQEETGTGRAASDTAIRTARVVLTGIAKNDGPERKVYLRAARQGEAYYLDLGDDSWRAIEITAADWRLVEHPPVYFWRSNTTRPLPLPTPGGDLALLWQYANIPEADRPLVLAWMLDAWRPETPFPVLELIGQQGTAKSSTQDRLRDCLDPNAVNLRSAPKSVEDLFVSAGSNWLASLNNLSHLSANVQDAICNLATGGGFASRTLYTNADETLIEAKRPVVLNGIVPLVTAQDLADRVVHVELPEVEGYRRESDIRADFERDRPLIVGGLLDLFVRTLAKLPEAQVERPPRMADFALLGEAMQMAQGKPAGAFMRLYGANRRESVARGLEASPIAQALRDFAETKSKGNRSALVFTGNWKQLLKELDPYRDQAEAWPKSTQGFSGIIRRQRPALAQVGVFITIGGHTKQGTEVMVKWSQPGDGDEGDEGDKRSETSLSDGGVKRDVEVF